MERGLLESLRRYRPREGKDPLENFFTEAFAWILRHSPDFSKYILEKLGLEKEIDISNCNWDTQYNFNGLYPDMVCISGNSALIFEHKCWSGLHENQIKNYRDYAKENFENYKIILVTASKFQHEQNPDFSLCWNDIYDYILEWEHEMITESFIFADFWQLIASVGMGPLAPISSESLRYYYASDKFKVNISNMIKSDLEERYGKDWRELYIKTGRGKAYGEADGRVGLNLYVNWRPGLFVGFLLDGADHRTEPIDKFKGPDFCIIVSFEQDLHLEYQKNKYYKLFVSNMSNNIIRLNKGWELYHHIEDKAKNPNPWHPIHIRKTAINVFAGTQTFEKQANVFYNAAKPVLTMIVEDPNWKMLRSEYN